MATARINVISHNLGGGTTYGTHLFSNGLAQVGSVMRIVQGSESSDQTRIDVVTLQECLRPEFNLWVERGWWGVFVPMTTADENKFRGNEDKGQAILSRFPIVSYHATPLGMLEGVSTGKEFNLLCAKIDHPEFEGYEDDLWVATTHLWSAGLDKNGVAYSGEVNDAIRELQAEAIASHLNPRVKWARKYILTGDFNTGPKTQAIDHLHRVNRDGSVGVAKFWEADQFKGTTQLQRDGRDTVTGRKIDYWFASHSGVNPETGIGMTLHSASENGGDKHDKILNGTVRWTDLA